MYQLAWTPFLGSHVEPPCAFYRVPHVCDDDNAECKPSFVSGLNSGVLSPSNDPLGKPCAHVRKTRAFDKAQETRSFDKATDESSGYKMTCSDCNAECTANFSPPISPESAEKPPVASSSSAGVVRVLSRAPVFLLGNNLGLPRNTVTASSTEW